MRPGVSDDWRQVAEAARDEQDPTKLMQLVEQLNRELKERAERLQPQPNEEQPNKISGRTLMSRRL